MQSALHILQYRQKWQVPINAAAAPKRAVQQSRS